VRQKGSDAEKNRTIVRRGGEKERNREKRGKERKWGKQWGAACGSAKKKNQKDDT